MAPPRKADAAPDLEKKPQGNEHRLDQADLSQAKSGADAMSNLAALQQSAGNLAVGGLVQRQPVRQAKGGRRSNQVSFGPRAEILNFAVLFELATTRDALSTGRFDNASFAFTSPRLARAAELLAFVVGAIANERRGGQIHQAAEIWRSIGSDVRAILTQAGQHGAPLDDAWSGFARLQEALNSEQAEELVRAGEASADLATPDAGLYVEQDRELGRIYQALVKVIDESKGIIQWNDRHIYRMTGVGGVGATEAQVRLMNYGRTALGAYVLWRDFQTLDERLAEARRQGWIHEYGTYAEFISRATTIAVDTTNAVVGLLRASTSSLRDAAVKASLQAAFNSGVAGSRFGDLAAAQVRYEARLARFEGVRWAGGLSGGFQIVSGLWNLIIAIRDDDVRGGVSAGHSIAQGGITLGGAITAPGQE